jgi:hypothetical protein
MSTHGRYGLKWSVNEVLSLQREFELLGWDINQIAQKHQRTPNAIMYKLDQEGFADYNELYSTYHNLNTSTSVEKTTELNFESFHDDSDEEFADDSDDEDFEDDDADDEDEEDEDEEDVANLSERVDNLEGSISEIKDMIKQMMTSFSKSKSYKSSYKSSYSA